MGQASVPARARNETLAYNNAPTPHKSLGIARYEAAQQSAFTVWREAYMKLRGGGDVSTTIPRPARARGCARQFVDAY
jgi:hypothetical protein